MQEVCLDDHTSQVWCCMDGVQLMFRSQDLAPGTEPMALSVRDDPASNFVQARHVRTCLLLLDLHHSFGIPL